MRVMAFEAHPDDIDHFCAGTLAKYAASGADIAVVVMTDGSGGSPDRPVEEIARIREAETRASAAVIGAEVFWMGYRDAFLFNGPEIRTHAIDIIRQFRPDVILTLDRDNDYHPDHLACGQIVWDTHVLVTVPNIDTGTPPCETIPEIFYMDTPAGINFVPEFYVDTTDHWEEKKRMVLCHESQEEWCQGETTRSDNADRIQPYIEEWAAGLTRDELYHLLQSEGTPGGPVLNAAEVRDWVQMKERGFFVEIEHPEAGSLGYAGAPYRFSGVETAMERAPLLGEHNAEIYGNELGYTEEDLRRMSAAGVI